MRRSGLVVVCLLALVLFLPAAEARDRTPVTDGAGKARPPAAALAADTVIDPLIDWPVHYGLQNTGLIRAVFGNNGTFGAQWAPRPDIPGWPKVSFEVPVGSGIEYLFGGGIWIGGVVGDDTLVSTGTDGWVGMTEMFPDDLSGGITELHGAGDFAMRAEFSDTNTVLPPPDYEDGNAPHQPLNVEVANRSYVWRTSPGEEAVIYDMVVTNIGPDFIADAYIGFYFDADVCLDCGAGEGFADDLTGSLQEHGIGYIIDNDGDFGPVSVTPRAFCFKMLESSVPIVDTNFNWWISNGTSSLDFGPRRKATPDDPFRDFGTGGLGTPAGDRNKYYILRHDEWDYDQIRTAAIGPDDTTWMEPALPPSVPLDFAEGHDARFLMSFGSFNLARGQSERFIFATFTTDSIHTLASNVNNLPFNPQTYLGNLDFSSMIRNATIADSLATLLLDPSSPPVGLRIVEANGTDITVGWDPWRFGGEDGYAVFRSDVDPADLPYPGVAPPWLTLPGLQVAGFTDPGETQYQLAGLATDRFHLISVSRLTPEGTGEPAHPLTVRVGGRDPAPSFGAEYAYVLPGNSVELSWTIPHATQVNHYNLYRFDTPGAAAKAYHAFYDRGIAAATIPPADTFDVDGTRYFYYAMTPYATLPASATTFTDASIVEGATYLITAVDPTGYESRFSAPIEVIEAPIRDKDVLVLTHGNLTGIQYMDVPDVYAFYDSVLTGYNYDIYSWGDTNKSQINTDWHLLMEYELVIIDDDLMDAIFRPIWEDTASAFSRYLLSGGRLAYFGSLASMTGVNGITGTPFRTAAKHPLMERFFGIDSAGIIPTLYLASLYGFPAAYADSMFGFHRAIPAALDRTDLDYDQTRSRINPNTSVLQLWPTNAPLSVSTFMPSERGEVTHVYGADPAISSVVEGKPVGVFTQTGSAETYAFGFHLWYMEVPGARALIDAMFDRSIMAVFDPDTVSIANAWNINPETLTVYIGNLPAGLSVYDIATESLLLSGTVAPLSVNYASNAGGFTGDVLVLTVPAENILAPLQGTYGLVHYPVAVAGAFSGGESFIVYAGLVVMGKLAGDANGDGILNVADLTAAIDYLFRGGPALDPTDADVTGDCTYNVADITRLIGHLFRGGQTPEPCLTSP